MTESISDIAKEYLTEEELKSLKRSKKFSDEERIALMNLMAHKDFPTLVKILLDITNFNGNNYTDNVNLTYYLGGSSNVMRELISIFDEIDVTYYPRILLNIVSEAKNNERTNH